MDLTTLQWILGIGFGGLGSMMLFLHLSIKTEMCGKFFSLKAELDEVKNDIKEIRTSLNRMEGAFYNKDCCMLKDHKDAKKVE